MNMKIVRYAQNKFFGYYTDYQIKKSVSKKVVEHELFLAKLKQGGDAESIITFTDGFKLLCSNADLNAVAETCVTEDYQLHNFLKIKPGDVVFDVGANMGSFAIYAAKKGARVYAFEPIKENYNRLIANIKLNHLEQSITAFEYGIYSHSGTQSLHISDNNKGGHSVLDNGGHSAVEITIKRLADVFAELGVSSVDLLKIDIEGAEYEIFEHLTTDEAQKIKKIVGEYHMFPDYSKHNFRVLKQKLKKHYKVVQSYWPYNFYAHN